MKDAFCVWSLPPGAVVAMVGWCGGSSGQHLEAGGSWNLEAGGGKNSHYVQWHCGMVNWCGWGESNGHCPESGGGHHPEAGSGIRCKGVVALLGCSFVQPDKAKNVLIRKLVMVMIEVFHHCKDRKSSNEMVVIQKLMWWQKQALHTLTSGGFVWPGGNQMVIIQNLVTVIIWKLVVGLGVRVQ